ncbi:cation diffusion facilitator family transporter [Bacillus sp. FJAT-45066]|uniref:cation diffusion facilitator family transporter n=1 Tax=Bacillus sp. FJAT-45066 TaxID=2011010 RepID=UPI000BB6A744|nr:cation diffusion facilitator family transporter [Bacillus sp. FJAT-45066]
MVNKDLKKGEKGAWISIVTYIFLASVKLVVGYTGQSSALRADGLNNLTDVVASVAVLIGLKIAQKPADENHKYGHSRAETIASLLAGIIIFTVGLQVIITSFQLFFNPIITKPNILAAFIGLFSAVIMFFVYRFNKKLSKQIGSKALYSAAQDNRADALVSLGTVVGITGAYFGIVWLDPVTAAIVGIIICFTAWGILKDTIYELTDGFEANELNKIEDTISTTPGVKFVKEIKGRLSGNQPLVDATIFVDPSLTVSESHDISEEIEARLYSLHNIKQAHIHIEPF